jgi:hypothetical protein
MSGVDLGQLRERVLDQVEAAIERVYELLTARERPRIALDQIMDCEGLEPQFEYRLEVDYKILQRLPELGLPKYFWFFTVKGLVDRVLTSGALLGDDLMIVEAETREGADKKALAGLAATIEIAREVRAGSIMLLPGPDGVDQIAAGRRADVGGAPMNGEMADKIGRMMSDRIQENQPRFSARQAKWRLH